jgi:hypothetical protein
MSPQKSSFEPRQSSTLYSILEQEIFKVILITLHLTQPDFNKNIQDILQHSPTNLFTLMFFVYLLKVKISVLK